MPLPLRLFISAALVVFDEEEDDDGRAWYGARTEEDGLLKGL